MELKHARQSADLLCLVLLTLVVDLLFESPPDCLVLLLWLVEEVANDGSIRFDDESFLLAAALILLTLLRVIAEDLLCAYLELKESESALHPLLRAVSLLR